MQIGRVNNGKIAVVGTGSLALAVARALRTQGVETSLLASITSDIPEFLGVVEATGGMAPAFDCAMTALGKGLPVISASVLLAGVHGQVLMTAARAQDVGLGFSGALLGPLPVPQVGEEMILLADGAGHDMLRLMVDRGLGAEMAQQEVLARREDASDLGGKQTLCRALALHGLWSGQAWLNPGAVKKADLTQLTSARAREIRRAGYALRFGALISKGEIFVGPIAIGAEELLAQREGLVIQAGPVVMEINQDQNDRAVAGITHDVKLLLANQLALPLQAPKQENAAAFEGEFMPLAEGISIPVIGQPAASLLRVAA